MEWTDILAKVFEIVIFPLLGLATSYLICLIKTKIDEIKQNQKSDLAVKYLNMLDKVICEAVIATNQTYVNSLKEEGAFDWEAQKEAFNMTYEAVMQILTEEAKTCLNEVIADAELYIANKIEEQVNWNKD